MPLFTAKCNDSVWTVAIRSGRRRAASIATSKVVGTLKPQSLPSSRCPFAIRGRSHDQLLPNSPIVNMCKRDEHAHSDALDDDCSGPRLDTGSISALSGIPNTAG